MSKISFNPDAYKGRTLKSVKKLYAGRSEDIQRKAERFWRQMNPKKTQRSGSDEEE